MFALCQTDFAETWLSTILDNTVHLHIRRWLQLPINTCVEEVVSLPTKMCGLNIPSIKNYAANLRLTMRSGLMNSKSSDINQLWKDTNVKNVLIDSALMNAGSLQTAKKVLKLQSQNSALEHVSSLQLQGLSITSVIDNIKSSTILAWSKTIQSLSTVLFCFTRKGLQQQLATMTNLSRWGKTNSAKCPLCQQDQTNKHVLSNCAAPAALKRFKFRHDAVLYIFCNWLKSVIFPGATLYADIPGFEALDAIFVSLRPDIAVTYNGNIFLCELTVCHETNLLKSRDYKRSKYANIAFNITSEFRKHIVKLETVELTVFGFMSDCSNFTKSVTNMLLPDSIRANIIRNVIGNSYNIYLNRNHD